LGTFGVVVALPSPVDLQMPISPRGAELASPLKQSYTAETGFLLSFLIAILMSAPNPITQIRAHREIKTMGSVGNIVERWKRPD